MRFNPINPNGAAPDPEPEPTPRGKARKSKSYKAQPSTWVVPPGTVCQLTENREKKGLELRFPAAPSEAVRNQLKAAGWRWSRFGGCWYIRETPEAQQWATNFIATYQPVPEGAQIVGQAIVAAAGTAFEAELKAEAEHGHQISSSAGSRELATELDLQARLAKARRQLNDLKDFIGHAQRECLRECLKGEEQEFFFELVQTYYDRITNMPATRGQEGMGGQAIAHLHYFAGGRANFWITEKDIGAPDDAENGIPPQSQAFGRADLFGDGGEIGYISIAEIIENGGELDLYFNPKSLDDLAGKTKPVPPRPVAPPAAAAEPVPAPSMDVPPIATTVPSWRQRFKVGQASSLSQ